MTVNERIRLVRREFHLTQDEFASRLGLKRNSITMIESGRPTSDQTIFAICREFGISEEWLRTGTGEMKTSASREQEMAALVRSLMEDSPESFRSALVTTLLRFDPNGPEWEILERIYDGIAKNRNPGE